MFVSDMQALLPNLLTKSKQKSPHPVDIYGEKDDDTGGFLDDHSVVAHGHHAAHHSNAVITDMALLKQDVKEFGGTKGGGLFKKSSFVDLISHKKRKDSALMAAHSWQFRASMQSKDGWLSNLRRNLNDSTVKALDESSFTEAQKKKREALRKQVEAEVHKLETAVSYTAAFAKEIVPGSSKHYDPLKVVEDFDILETQVQLGKAAGEAQKVFIEAELERQKRHGNHPAARKNTRSMNKLALRDQHFPDIILDSMVNTFKEQPALDSKHVTYSDLLHNAALVDVTAKEYRSALLKYDRAIIANPNHYPSLFNRARLFVTIKKRKKAIKDFLDCARLRPTDPAAFYNIGIVYNMDKKVTQADKYFQKAYDLNSTDTKVLSNFALNLRRSGSFVKSRHEYVSLREHYREDNAADLRKTARAYILNDPELKKKLLVGKKQHLPKHFEYGTKEARKYIREQYSTNSRDSQSKESMKQAAIMSLITHPHSEFPRMDYKVEDRPPLINPYLEGGFRMGQEDNDFQEARAILSLHADERTLEDLDFLVEDFAQPEFMDRFPEPLRRKLWAVFKYSHVHAGEIICKEGEHPVCLNIVWEGKVRLQREVHHKFASRTMTVGHVNSGNSVCEMELIRRIPYRYSAIAQTDIEMLTLSLQHYNKTIKKHDEEDSINKADLIREAKIFNSWESNEIIKISKLARSRFYSTGDIIIQQDQVADEFFILRRGLLVAVHRENFESVDYDLNVAKLVPGDIFGERSIVDPMNGRYRFSIKCETRVEVMVLGKEMIHVSKVTPAVRDTIDKMKIRKFGKMSAVQQISDLRATEINRKKVLYKMNFISQDTYKKQRYDPQPWQKKLPWLNPGLYKEN